jgi:hypothetical protein
MKIVQTLKYLESIRPNQFLWQSLSLLDELMQIARIVPHDQTLIPAIMFGSIITID